MIEVTYVPYQYFKVRIRRVNLRFWPAKPLCNCMLFECFIKGESRLDGPYPCCHWKSIGVSKDRCAMS